jgi:ribonuclease HI
MVYRFLKCFVDGGVRGRNPSPNGVYWSAVIYDGATKLTTIRKASKAYHINIDSEWLAVLEALRWIIANRAPNQPVVIYSDSDTVVQQFNGSYKISNAKHLELYLECKALADQLPWVSLTWTPRRIIVAELGH